MAMTHAGGKHPWENLEPNPKNPIISSFFRNIGRADRLGSGVRNLYKYSKYYSGEEPIFTEDDVFRIIVPLNDAYSFDFGLIKDEQKNADKVPINADKMPINMLSSQQKILFDFLEENGKITSHQAEELLNVKQRRARSILSEMVDLGIVERQGVYKRTIYVLNITRED